MTNTTHLLNTHLCPCGRLNAAGKPLMFVQCCGQYLDHFDSMPAPDPQSLMRSRYTAFVLKRERYLLDTWSAEQRPGAIEFDALTKWLGLEVKSQKIHDEHHGEVEFVARYRIEGRATRMHERSLFCKKNGRWYYVKAKE